MKLAGSELPPLPWAWAWCVWFMHVYVDFRSIKENGTWGQHLSHGSVTNWSLVVQPPRIEPSYVDHQILFISKSQI